MKYPDNSMPLAGMKRCSLMLLWLLLPALMPMAAQAAGEWDQVGRVLKEGKAAAVRQLSSQERAILQATVALKTDRPEQALTMLAAAKQARDPLVALLEAEAHRLQAIHAMREAGAYGDGVKREQRLLASADLNNGLGEADARLRAFMDRLNRQVGDPVDILMPGPNVANIFMFDKARNRLFVYEPTSAGLRQITDEYVVTGTVVGDKQRRGDGRTPHGVYRFVKKLQGRQLESRYGPVAFPIDYPNELDRLHHKDGSGIWLHGYPMDVSRRPPQDTRGCFSLSNDRLLTMARYVKLRHTWVIVGENFAFDQPARKRELLESVKRDIEVWRRDWTRLDTEAYLSHYHRKFRSGKRDLAAWKRYKRRVNANKSFVEVGFANMTLIHDPNRWPEGEVVVAEFDQSYRSSNYADHGRKRLYLARADRSQPWRILLEESLEQ